jgi:peptide chain release factor 2
MRTETESVVTRSKNRYLCLGGIFDPDQAKARLAILDREAEAPNFWSDARRAQSLMRERQQIEAALPPSTASPASSMTTFELVALGEEEGTKASSPRPRMH